MDAAGASVRSISRKQKLHTSTIRRRLKRKNSAFALTDKPRSGRPSKITAPLVASSSTLIHRRSTNSLRKMQAHFMRKGNKLSLGTMSKLLSLGRNRSVKPRRAPKLLPRHKRARVAFAKAHQHDGAGEFQKWVFSDESYFSVDTAARRVWIKTDDPIPTRGTRKPARFAFLFRTISPHVWVRLTACSFGGCPFPLPPTMSPPPPTTPYSGAPDESHGVRCYYLLWHLRLDGVP
jgi:transposase